MRCPCAQHGDFSVTIERLPSDSFEVSFERFWKRLVDLVAFNASDGRYLTVHGYTIMVKI